MCSSPSMFSALHVLLPILKIPDPARSTRDAKTVNHCPDPPQASVFTRKWFFKGFMKVMVRVEPRRFNEGSVAPRGLGRFGVQGFKP